jgi:hypothetical protein
VKPIVKHIKDIERHVSIAKQNCKIPPADGLSVDESASIRLYTMEMKPHDQCLYFVLNKNLRSEDRNLLKDWFLYLKLIISSLSKISSISCLIFRGIKMNLSQEYTIGQKVVWWAFSSCTNSMKVLENGPFLGKTGVRTLFEIDCYSGKNICQHSAFPKENEILLIAATQFQIVSSLDAGHDLHIIHLKQIKPEFRLIEEVSASNASSSISVHQINPTSFEPTGLLQKNTPPKAIPSAPTVDSTYHNSDLERYIARFQSFSHVNLDEQQLTDQDMRIVVDQAIKNKQCVKLSLHNNRISSQGILILARGVSESTTLEELDLSGNHLSHEDLFPLMRELSVNRVATVNQWKCCGIAKVKVSE